MPSAERANVAVIGAAGFVGQALLAAFAQASEPVTAIVRGNAEISFGVTPHRVLSPAEAGRVGPFDVVINLAYPTSGKAHTWQHQTRDLFRSLDELLADHGRLIHVSTLAVFGLALDRPVSAESVRARRDDPYVEAKIAAEHAAERLSRRAGRVDIVRLGNVVGPGSPSWGVNLVHRLLTGRPVGVAGKPGRSNATDVANVASYLRFLAADPIEGASVRHHHLAELGDTLWGTWLAPLGSALGVEPLLLETADLSGTTLLGELAVAVSPLHPRAVYTRLGAGRVTGSWMRTVRRRTPRAAGRLLEKPDVAFASEPPLSPDERTFLAIMSNQQRFDAHVVDGWRPEIGAQESVDRMVAWLRESWDGVAT